MATAIKKKAAKKAARPAAIYLYGISLPAKRSVTVRAEAVDGSSAIEALRVGDFSCWISRVDRSEYADHLAENMENLDWLATIGVRHQRAVADLALKVELL